MVKKRKRNKIKFFLISLLLNSVDRDTIHMILDKEEHRADMIGNFIRSNYIMKLKNYFG